MRWFGRRQDPSGDPDAALQEARARYDELRGATARCLYAAHKLAGEARRQEAIAEASRTAARAALEAKDSRGSRVMVAAARTALDLARDAAAAHAELRASADGALEGLRELGRAIAELERERLRAAAIPMGAAAVPSLEEAQRALEVLEAERALDRELA